MLISQALTHIFQKLPSYSSNVELEKPFQEFMAVFPEKTFSATIAERVYLGIPNAQKFPKQIELPDFLTSLSHGLTDIGERMDMLDLYIFIVFMFRFLAEMYPEIPVKRLTMDAFTASLKEIIPGYADIQETIDTFARFRPSEN